MNLDSITFEINGDISPDELDAFRHANWPQAGVVAWAEMRPKSLFWITARHGTRLIGFANIIGDGGAHAVLLDVIVADEFRRRGIGKRIVTRAAEEAGSIGAEWLHVDFEPDMRSFYDECGFRPTSAGLLRVGTDE